MLVCVHVCASGPETINNYVWCDMIRMDLYDWLNKFYTFIWQLGMYQYTQVYISLLR